MGSKGVVREYSEKYLGDVWRDARSIGNCLGWEEDKVAEACRLPAYHIDWLFMRYPVGKSNDSRNVFTGLHHLRLLLDKAEGEVTLTPRQAMMLMDHRRADPPITLDNVQFAQHWLSNDPRRLHYLVLPPVHPARLGLVLRRHGLTFEAMERACELAPGAMQELSKLPAQRGRLELIATTLSIPWEELEDVLFCAELPKGYGEGEGPEVVIVGAEEAPAVEEARAARGEIASIASMEHPLLVEEREVPGVGLKLLLGQAGPAPEDTMVVMYAVCNYIDIITQDQVAKLLERSWAKGRLGKSPIRLENGSTQHDVWLLGRHAFMMWLGGINENKIAEEKRPGLIALQEKCAEVLDMFFFDRKKLRRELEGPTDSKVLQIVEKQSASIDKLVGGIDKLAGGLGTLVGIIGGLAERFSGLESLSASEYEVIDNGTAVRHRETGAIWDTLKGLEAHLAAYEEGKEDSLLTRWGSTRGYFTRLTKRKGKDGRPLLTVSEPRIVKAQRWESYTPPITYTRHLAPLSGMKRMPLSEVNLPGLAESTSETGTLSRYVYLRDELQKLYDLYDHWASLAFPSFREERRVLSDGKPHTVFYPRLEQVREILLLDSSFNEQFTDEEGVLKEDERDAIIKAKTSVFSATYPRPGKPFGNGEQAQVSA